MHNVALRPVQPLPVSAGLHGTRQQHLDAPRNRDTGPQLHMRYERCAPGDHMHLAHCRIGQQSREKRLPDKARGSSQRDAPHDASAACSITTHT